MSIALGHMQHAYMQTDGTYKFPNSREGDILKQAKAELEAVRAELGGIERRKSSPLSTPSQVNFNRGWNRLHSIVQAALQGESHE